MADWGVPDPATVEGSEEQKAKAFMDVAITLKRRIESMLSLPIDRLAGMSLQRELDQIGKARHLIPALCTVTAKPLLR